MRADISTKHSSNIDLRSDTVTRPDSGMFEAMMAASVGDDVYGEDQTVNALEEKAAKLLGKEAAVFVSSGTQSNLIAMLTHCRRGEEVITGEQYHVSVSEAHGASVLGGIAICPLQTNERGSLTVDQISAAIKPDDPHYPISRLLCLENTVSGEVQVPEHMLMLCRAGRQGGLSLHLDGARLMNASIALEKSAAELVDPFDSISLCLSKGLGAPVGSLLSGSNEFIRIARRNRKLLGGGMRQAGILAACGLYALEHNIDRLAEDHANAAILAEGLARIKDLKVWQQTNMVFIELADDHAAELQASLAEQGIVISAGFPSIRLVTHLDVDSSDIERVVDSISSFYRNR
ncbi:MAG: low-specificity L-threonine aldolase [Gammaproteobacteria bacterium]|nr:low-specificity L-threonine aldolase [Gammaproteobacteria bacterium]